MWVCLTPLHLHLWLVPRYMVSVCLVKQSLQICASQWLIVGEAYSSTAGRLWRRMKKSRCGTTEHNWTRIGHNVCRMEPIMQSPWLFMMGSKRSLTAKKTSTRRKRRRRRQRNPRRGGGKCRAAVKVVVGTALHKVRPQVLCACQTFSNNDSGLFLDLRAFTNFSSECERLKPATCSRILPRLCLQGLTKTDRAVLIFVDVADNLISMTPTRLALIHICIIHCIYTQVQCWLC